MEIDIALQMNCAGKIYSVGKNHASTPGPIAGSDCFLKGLSAVSCSIADCPKIRNWEIAFRKNRRLDSCQDLRYLRPGIICLLIIGQSCVNEVKFPKCCLPDERASC